MNPPSSIWSPFDGHWETALTSSEWEARFVGPVPTACASWLKPGPRAAFVPCIHPDGCGQPHRVKRLSDRKSWLAVTHTADCESFPLDAAAIETRRLDVDSVAHLIAHTLKLDGVALERVRNDPALLRLGHTGRNGLPCFLSVACSPAAVSREVASILLIQPAPVIVFVPLARSIPTALRATVRVSGGGLLALDELLDFDAGGQLIARKALIDFVPGLTTAKPSYPVLGGRASFTRGNTWPHARPEKPKWSDIMLTMHLQEVAIGFGASQAKFDYRDIDGFTDRRGGKKPNRLWHLLRAFAIKDGTLPLPRKDEDPVRVRTLAELDRVLGRFFDLSESAFQRESAERRVHTRFRLRLKT